MISPNEQLLLRAAFASTASAARLEAFQAWQAEVDLDDLPPGHYQLLPALYRQLEHSGVDHLWMGRLRGVYRRNWTQSQLTARRLTDWLAAMQTSHVRALVLADCGEHSGLPTTLAVPASEAGVAIASLLGCGLAPVPKTAQILSPEFRSWVPSCRLRSEDGCELVLRWHLLDECPTPQADAPFRQSAVPGVVSGVDALILAPAEALLVACISAGRQTREALAHLLRAATILQASESVDWDRVGHLGLELGLSRDVARVLADLHDTLGLVVPVDCLLGEHRGGPQSRPGVTGEGLPDETLLHKATRHLRRFRTLAKAQGGFPGPGAFLSYLQHSWALGSRGQAARRILARLTSRR